MRKRLGKYLAKYRLFREDPDSGTEQLFGFTSPCTLFCAAPGVPDKAWGRLWKDLTDFKADDWLVAHALAHGCTVVTHERADNSVKKIKIPNACRELDVCYMNPIRCSATNAPGLS